MPKIMCNIQTNAKNMQNKRPYMEKISKNIQKYAENMPKISSLRRRSPTLCCVGSIFWIHIYVLLLIFQLQYILGMAMGYDHIVDILTDIQMSSGYVELFLGCVRGHYPRESLIWSFDSDDVFLFAPQFLTFTQQQKSLFTQTVRPPSLFPHLSNYCSNKNPNLS